MKIIGIEGMTTQQIQEEINNGAKFVYYRYCISVIVMTFRRSTDIYFIRPGQHGAVKGMGWTALTMLLGWWGIPWGPIYSVSSLATNLQGGKDVTGQIVHSLNVQELVS